MASVAEAMMDEAGSCVDGPDLARDFGFVQHGRERSCVRPVCAVLSDRWP